jgi:hypothetical protein
MFHFPTCLAPDAITDNLFFLDSFNHVVGWKRLSVEATPYPLMYWMVDNNNLILLDYGNYALRVISIKKSGVAIAHT